MKRKIRRGRKKEGACYLRRRALLYKLMLIEAYFCTDNFDPLKGLIKKVLLLNNIPQRCQMIKLLTRKRANRVLILGQGVCKKKYFL